MRGSFILAAALALGPGSALAEDPLVADAISGADAIVPPPKNETAQTTTPAEGDGNIITNFIKNLQDRLAQLAKENEAAANKEAEAKKKKSGELFPPGMTMSEALTKALEQARRELEEEEKAGQTVSNLKPEQKTLLRQALTGTIPGYSGQTFSTTPRPVAKAGPPPPAPADRRRGDDAFKKASRLGDQLKKGLGSGGGDLAGPNEGSSASGAVAGAAKAGAVNPLLPKSKSELLLAAVSGFGGSFEASGLKVRNTEILRQDGAPATDKDLAALSARIEGEPTALMRRPDYFTVLPREKFQELKEEYAQKPALRDAQFKHIADTGRDFQRSQSCEKLSGGCNAFAQKSYRKGEDVPPEDLSAIHSDLMEDRDFDADTADAAEKEDAAASAAPVKKGVGRAAVKSIYARLNIVIAGVQSFFGSDPSANSRGAGQASLASAIGLPSPAGRAAPLVISEPRKLGQAAAPRALSAPSASAPLERQPRRTVPLLAGGFILAGLGLLRMLRG